MISSNIKLVCSFSPENSDVFIHKLPAFFGPSKDVVEKQFDLCLKEFKIRQYFKVVLAQLRVEARLKIYAKQQLRRGITTTTKREKKRWRLHARMARGIYADGVFYITYGHSRQYYMFYLNHQAEDIKSHYIELMSAPRWSRKRFDLRPLLSDCDSYDPLPLNDLHFDIMNGIP
jgi:hypothetical protein